MITALLTSIGQSHYRTISKLYNQGSLPKTTVCAIITAALFVLTIYYAKHIPAFFKDAHQNLAEGN